MTLPKRLMETLTRAFSIKQAEDGDISDVDLRSALDDALRATEPGYEWVERVYPETSRVIYSVFPGNEVMLMERTFTVDSDGKITLNDDRKEVEATVEYKTVAAEGTEVAEKESVVEPQPQVQSQSECTCHKGENMEKKDLISKVIANKNGLFKEEDRKVLEGMSEDRLKALADGMEEKDEEKKEETPVVEPAKKEETVVTPPVTDPNTVQVSTEELASLRSLAADVKRREQEYQDRLIGELVGAKGVNYTKDDLKSTPIALLEKMVANHGIDVGNLTTLSYSIRPLPVNTDDDSYLEPPDSYDLKGLEAKRNGAAAVSKEN